MNDQKRLMRRFTILWFISLVLILAILFVTLRDNKESVRRYIDQQIQSASLTKAEPIAGKDGKDGVDGITRTVEEQKIIHETVTLPGPAGPAGQNGLNGRDGQDGKDGLSGKDGRELLIQVNPETGDIETKYSDDSFWQVLLPCEAIQKVCEVEDGRTD